MFTQKIKTHYKSVATSNLFQRAFGEEGEHIREKMEKLSEQAKEIAQRESDDHGIFEGSPVIQKGKEAQYSTLRKQYLKLVQELASL